VVLEHTNLFSGLHIEDLSRSIATSCNIFAVVTESHTANHTLMVQRVDEVDIEDALHLGVEDGIPIISRLLVVGGDVVNFEITE